MGRDPTPPAGSSLEQRVYRIELTIARWTLLMAAWQATLGLILVAFVAAITALVFRSIP